MSERANGEFDDFAVNVITPIMNKIYEVAFDCFETFKHDSDEPVTVPLGVKEGMLEKLEKITQFCKEQKSYYESASIIGFALDRDGMKPSRKYGDMAAISHALFNLIKAKDDQIKKELKDVNRKNEEERIASIMGFL
jgi:hypothetical protein